MKCANPFIRNHRGRLHRLRSLTPDEKLDMTPFPCGYCLPCKINKARTWQHRIMLESKSHSKNSFVTLTYSDDQVPMNDHGEPILLKYELQNFIKRLRKFYKSGAIRYFAIGEYGDTTQRPHYHICIFGLNKDDTEVIEKAWSLKNEQIGFIDIGNIELESARYISGYCIKKLTNEKDERLYGRPPEFMLSSRKGGGIGKQETVRIANQIKNNPYFDTETILNQFNIGGKRYPLGGYLSSILQTVIGTSSDSKRMALETYQKKLFNENLAHTEDYYINIIKNSDNHRLKLEKKHKIFNKEKTL